MGLNMTVPMVLWMSYRGHARAQNLEMAASMIVPSLAAAILAWAAWSGRRPVSPIEHAAMIPAMLGVMHWRYEHYARHHR
jgi:hypothetical protein